MLRIEARSSPPKPTAARFHIERRVGFFDCRAEHVNDRILAVARAAAVAGMADYRILDVLPDICTAKLVVKPVPPRMRRIESLVGQRRQLVGQTTDNRANPLRRVAALDPNRSGLSSQSGRCSTYCKRNFAPVTISSLPTRGGVGGVCAT